jgi:hypothetical protein
VSDVDAGLVTRNRRAGLAIGLVVLSHWFGDLLVHTPDLPLTLSQDSAVGFGLWTRPVLSWALEMILLAGAWAWARGAVIGRGRKAGDQLVVTLLVIQTLSEFVIPTPPDMVQLGISGLFLYAVVAYLGLRVDRAEGKSETAT